MTVEMLKGFVAEKYQRGEVYFPTEPLDRNRLLRPNADPEPEYMRAMRVLGTWIDNCSENKSSFLLSQTKIPAALALTVLRKLEADGMVTLTALFSASQPSPWASDFLISVTGGYIGSKTEPLGALADYCKDSKLVPVRSSADMVRLYPVGFEKRFAGRASMYDFSALPSPFWAAATEAYLHAIGADPAKVVDAVDTWNTVWLEYAEPFKRLLLPGAPDSEFADQYVARRFGCAYTDLNQNMAPSSCAGKP
jgi:hypothetical protein